MAETSTKLVYPTGGDLFQPHVDIKKLAESATTIVPVSNRAEADAIAAVYQPSPSKPLYVDRADTGVLERNRGSGWQLSAPEPVTAHMQSTATANMAVGTYDFLGPMTVAHGTNFGPFTYSQSVGTTNGSHLVANVAGVFEIDAWITYATSVTDSFLRFVLNGSVLKNVIVRGVGTGSNQSRLTMRLDVGDRFGVQQYYTGSAARPATGQWTGLNMTYLG